MESSRVAIVTGAGRGVGRAEAFQLHAAGFAVVVNDLGSELAGGGRDDSVAESVAAQIRAAGGSAVAHCGDVGNPADVADLISLTIDTFGRLDVLVNNAGNFTAARVLPDMEIEELDATYHSHVRGSFNTSIAATRHWRDRARRTGARVDARIVNTVSDAYLLGAPWRLDYGAAKAALVSLTIGTAFTCNHFGVRANAFLPHAYTRMTSGEGQDGQAATRGRVLLPAEPQNGPDSAAAVVAALCGPAGQNINGQVIGGGAGRIRVLTGPVVTAEYHTDGLWDIDSAGQVLSTHYATEQPPYGVTSNGVNPLLEELRPDFDFLAHP